MAGLWVEIANLKTIYCHRPDWEMLVNSNESMKSITQETPDPAVES
jgi:hypothetical protein